MRQVNRNEDDNTVDGFGTEWTIFNQRKLAPEESRMIFEQYFSVFPWNHLPEHPIGFDLGCGSGRWDIFVAPRVSKLYCIDASADALQIAAQNVTFDNVEFIHASVDRIPLEDESADFGYSLGVLHHVPDTAAGMRSCVKKLKMGAPFLVYLYYAIENKPLWFRLIWRCSNAMRFVISHSPKFIRYGLSQIIAAVIYFPLAKIAAFVEKKGHSISTIPLSEYRNKSFYVMRTDAYDRFCTQLEQRFTRDEIYDMMMHSGLANIVFREEPPYWCAVGFRKE